MTDRELLELAAFAAGDQVEGWTMDADFVRVAILSSGARWQPLLKNRITDCMGDALRLVVKLSIVVTYQRNAPPELGVPRQCAVASCPSGQWFSEAGRDESAATRRAIVRAAAEIGKQMKASQ